MNRSIAFEADWIPYAGVNQFKFKGIISAFVQGTPIHRRKSIYFFEMVYVEEQFFSNPKNSFTSQYILYMTKSKVDELKIKKHSQILCKCLWPRRGSNSRPID